jgi:hypothetical protein
VTITVFDATTSILITARVAWTRRTGWRSGEIGLMFVDLSAETRASLTSLALAHRCVFGAAGKRAA